MNFLQQPFQDGWTNTNKFCKWTNWVQFTAQLSQDNAKHQFYLPHMQRVLDHIFWTSMPWLFDLSLDWHHGINTFAFFVTAHVLNIYTWDCYGNWQWCVFMQTYLAEIKTVNFVLYFATLKYQCRPLTLLFKINSKY